MSLPRMVEARQVFDQPTLKDYRKAIRQELVKKGLKDRVRKGQRIAVTAGSRGIANIAGILATVVEEIRKTGGEPFIVPAMGTAAPRPRARWRCCAAWASQRRASGHL
jgi:hypothetical protein